MPCRLAVHVSNGLISLGKLIRKAGHGVCVCVLKGSKEEWAWWKITAISWPPGNEP